jgi:DNA-binding SARP family transcriptional activator
MAEIGGHGEPALQLFNSFELRFGTGPEELAPSAQRLVAFLALAGPSRRAYAAGSLWPESTDPRAQADLRTTLWRIRRAHPGLIVTSGLMLALHSDLRIDVVELERTCHALLDSHGDPLPISFRMPPLRATLLPGWYDDWVLDARERVRQLHLHVLEELAERYLRHGDCGKALVLALSAAESEPLRESAQRLVVRSHLARGNAVEALARVEAFRRLLWREVGLAPSDDLLRLVDLRAG